MTAELRHSLDQYLASVDHAPACIDADGSLVFEAAEQLQAYADLLPDGRLELFAGVGYVSAEMLQAIVEADEADDFDDDEEPGRTASLMARRTGECAQWAVDVDRRTGLVAFSMFVAAIPSNPAEWAEVLDAFRRAIASWTPRLQRDAPDPLPHPGAGLADIASTAFLRC